MNRQNIIEEIKSSQDYLMLDCGSVVVYTGKCTGRSPDAKFIVEDDITSGVVDWEHNQSCTPNEWTNALDQARNFEKSAKKIYTQTLYGGRDESRQLSLTVKTSTPWQALFANNMFVRHRDSLAGALQEWELMCFPEMQELPRVYINFTWRKIIITGTHYAGEIKKSVFTVLNFLLPQGDVLPMHCSVNTDIAGHNPAVFFGLSGTGKTTLSADSSRVLVGDDEHGWSVDGLFNFEGGCYAKVIGLSKDAEPEIWDAVQASGAILENVVVSGDGIPNFDAKDYTENTRGSYPVDHIPNASLTGLAGHPRNIIFLTCDAFGVLPPVSRLSVDETVRHFLMGYTAKVAGTETGVTEPRATFSHCFGAPFMPCSPDVYANLLRKRIIENKVDCWLVNTGWSGGGYNIGQRMPISISRAVINLILSGELKECKFVTHSQTRLSIPSSTPDDKLNAYISPDDSWKILHEYNKAAAILMKMWRERS